MNNMTLASYFNDIVIHYYENSALMIKKGEQWGIQISTDHFRALSFLYPSDLVVGYNKQQQLQELLSPVIEYSPMNKAIDSCQFIRSDKGVVLILVAHTKEELLAITDNVCKKALDILQQELPNDFIRIGIGTMENGLSGIRKTYNNAIQAVSAGEKFKKNRRVLDYIGMEIYSAINAMVLAYGESLIRSILKQLTESEQSILGKYYKCKELVPETAAALGISEEDVLHCFKQIKERTGLDVNDTEDNFKLNFIMIAKRVLEKEKQRK